MTSREARELKLKVKNLERTVRILVAFMKNQNELNQNYGKSISDLEEEHIQHRKTADKIVAILEGEPNV